MECKLDKERSKEKRRELDKRKCHGVDPWIVGMVVLLTEEAGGGMLCISESGMMENSMLEVAGNNNKI